MLGSEWNYTQFSEVSSMHMEPWCMRMNVLGVNALVNTS